MNRKYNFYAGPSTMPVPVLERIHNEFMDYNDIGMSLIETSHRSKEYDEIHNKAISNLREILQIPDNFSILFLGGGATLQFAMVPMNLMRDKKQCDFTVSGAWSLKARNDAARFGKTNILFDGETKNYNILPDPADIHPGTESAYVHITSNETIGGVQWKSFPDTGNVPLVIDMSSDIMSRPLPWDKLSLVYAGAQKNLAPAGVTLVIIRDDLLESCADDLPAYLSYKIHADKNSLYNTPPVFSIYALMHNTEYIKEIGGMKEMAKRAKQRAEIIYSAIDNSNGFYSSPVKKNVRSNMNIVWHLRTEELEKKFLSESIERNMVGLKGHRLLGGCRASLYNAMPVEGAFTLAEFMNDFMKLNN